jgi:CheY-like chemotaxis protein
MAKNNDVVKNFLSTHHVLLVDKNPSSRVRLQKLIVDLGARVHMVSSVKSLTEAQEILRTKDVGLVMSDFMIEGGSGFDLFKNVRESLPKTTNTCFVLVTSNFSQAAVAKAAEEDVDSYVIKPYTVQSIQENLINTIMAKIKPSDYILKIEAGKKLMGSGLYDDALKIFNQAVKLHPKPALALFYIGQTEFLKNQNPEDKYNQGLAYNSIHFKCLMGLYDTFTKMKKTKEAYQIIKKIVDNFPANPQRLAQVVRLAIQTDNLQDMQQYYEVFTSLEERTAEITNYIGAGMYIAGKYYLNNKNLETATKYFDNVAVSCSEYTKFIRAIVTVLVDHKRADLAEKYLKRFPAGYDDHEDYLVANYLVDSRVITNPHQLVKAGLDIFNRNIRDPLFLETMIESMRKAELSQERIQPILEALQKVKPEYQSA